MKANFSSSGVNHRSDGVFKAMPAVLLKLGKCSEAKSVYLSLSTFPYFYNFIFYLY